MKKYSLSLIALCLFVNTPTSIAEMYKWVDPEGNISYSDQPPFKGADQLEPPSINTTPAVEAPKAAPKEEVDEETETQYSYFKIVSPENDATIRNNEGNFSVSLSVKPALDTTSGHYISIMLDGQTTHDKLSSTSASFNNVDRGTHKITASIKNKQGKTLKTTQTITVHLHRKSVLRKTPPSIQPVPAAARR